VSTHSTNIRIVEFKIYPSRSQQNELNRWLRLCCRIYNMALEQRITTYREKGESVNFYAQCATLTQERTKNSELECVPRQFLVSALRRVDRGMQAFFRRCESGKEKPGFPRFRPQQRYNSFEQVESAKFVHVNRIRIPKLGFIHARGPFDRVTTKTQKVLRIIRRASGWYAQVVCEFTPEVLPSTKQDCGFDLGLNSFLTLDSGEEVGNPRILRKAAKRLRVVQRMFCRRQEGSRRRLKAKRIVARVCEQLSRQRRGFCHRVSREIVNRFDRIAYEDLNIKGMIRGRFAKSISDAGWGLFIILLTVKAENAGRSVVKVDPAYTSQECPNCGAIVKKFLKQRVHDCPCGLVLRRDHASAIVIKNRAFRRDRGVPVRPLTDAMAGTMKREDLVEKSICVTIPVRSAGGKLV
jgi:putative transposase